MIASAYINLSWLHSSELESCPFVKLHLNNETAGFVDAQSRDIGHECEQRSQCSKRGRKVESQDHKVQEEQVQYLKL
jgi:hypothetical protein